VQLSSAPAADAALKSPAPSSAAEAAEPKSRSASDRDRGGDRKRNNGSSSKQRPEPPKKSDDAEAADADAAVDDTQPAAADAAAAEAEAQAPKRVRRPVAASELAGLNVDPKALESVGSDHGEHDDDETPKMMLRLRKRHDKEKDKDKDKEKEKEEQSDATRGEGRAGAGARPRPPRANNLIYIISLKTHDFTHDNSRRNAVHARCSQPARGWGGQEQGASPCAGGSCVFCAHVTAAAGFQPQALRGRLQRWCCTPQTVTIFTRAAM